MSGYVEAGLFYGCLSDRGVVRVGSVVPVTGDVIDVLYFVASTDRGLSVLVHGVLVANNTQLAAPSILSATY